MKRLTILLFCVTVVLMVLALGCGKSHNSENKQQNVIENEKIVYKEMTVNELKNEIDEKEKKLRDMDKETLEKSLNEDRVLMKENIYFKLKDAYFDNVDWKEVTRQLEGGNKFAAIPFMNKNEESKSIWILVDKEKSEELKKEFELGQRVIIEGVCLYRLLYNVSVGEVQLTPEVFLLGIQDLKSKKELKKYDFNKDNTDEIYKKFVELEIGQSIKKTENFLTFYKAEKDKDNINANAYRINKKLKDGDQKRIMNLFFDNKEIEGKKLSEFDYLDDAKVKKAKADDEEERKKVNDLIEKDFEEDYLLKIIKKHVCINDVEGKKKKIEESNSRCTYDDIIKIMGGEGYLLYQDKNSIKVLYLGKVSNKIICIYMTFLNDKGEWIITRMRKTDPNGWNINPYRDLVEWKVAPQWFLAK